MNIKKELEPKIRRRRKRKPVNEDLASAWVDEQPTHRHGLPDEATGHNGTLAPKRHDASSADDQAISEPAHQSTEAPGHNGAKVPERQDARAPKRQGTRKAKLERLHVRIDVDVMTRLRMYSIQQPRGERALRKLVEQALVEYLDQRGV